MSIRIMNRVWSNAKATGTDLVILLALADRADEDGVAWPGIAYLCQKARVKERATQTIIRKLENRGQLFIETGAGRKHTNYYIVLAGMERDEIKQVLMDRLGYTAEESAAAIDAIETKVQNIASNSEEIKGAKPVRKGAKLHAKGANKRHKKVQATAPDPSVNPSLSFSSSDGGKKLHELLIAEYDAKGRRAPDKFKTLEMRNKWISECEERLTPVDLEKAIRAALALDIVALPRLVAYVAKFGTQPRQSYNNQRTSAGNTVIQPAPAKQDEGKGMYL